MSIEKVTVYTDGASRGNPGPAAAAFVVSVDGQTIAESGATIGTATNNVAEYSALIQALEFVLGLGAKSVHIHSDSELMVRQMRGEYRVKHPDLIPFYEDAKLLAAKFSSVEYTHVRRSQNAEADRLCNEALDGQTIQPTTWTSAPVPNAPATIDSDHPVVSYLKMVQTEWSGGRVVEPSPAEVWNHIQGLIPSSKSRRRTKKPASE